ncbi:hypothetical protein IGI04_030053 [Brassica rapa subsp. trilocularis]|uniref:Uncharacterized protein n=1 Tax=Brassica rapa subsp. trilocularis TaxID=1813537 RepID=A0ABQ7LQG7_BRACM|nr:hypothetical protein IGI04_030053 [Brassica rapa subsp. trilocularis]
MSALVTELIEDHDNGALVITASSVHQLEDKLVLYRVSIDNNKYFRVEGFRMETRCFTAYVELDMIDGELRAFGVVWLAGTLALSDYMMKIIVTVHAAIYHVLELMRLISTMWEAGFMAGIKTEGESNGDTINGWKRYKRYSMDTYIYDNDVRYMMSLELLMMQVFYSQVKGGEVVVTALRQTLHFTKERFHLPRAPEWYTKGPTWCSVTRFWFKITGCYCMFNLEDKVVVN